MLKLEHVSKTFHPGTPDEVWRLGIESSKVSGGIPQLQNDELIIPLMMDLGFTPKESSRKGNALLYFKKADAIADFFTALGAPVTAMGVMTAKVDREMRNKVTRQLNCDSHNTDKTVSAAQEQIEAIRRYAREYGLDSLPEPLYDTALLRITNPEASLADLAKLSLPPVSKSCLNHRLRKIMELAETAE